MGLSDGDFECVEQDQQGVMESAAEFAVNSELPLPEEALTKVWED